MIVVGGAAESLNAFPGTYNLVLKKRLGFIKLALRNGASLVPVLSFGENDLWDQVLPAKSDSKSTRKLLTKGSGYIPEIHDVCTSSLAW
jgi:Diacylglycerol acyltransferase